MKTAPFLLGLLSVFLLTQCSESISQTPSSSADPEVVTEEASGMALAPDATEFPDNVQVVTFGAGCFWCVEEVFHQTDGVLSAVSGYMGGSEKDAVYKKVSYGRTDHVEVVQVHFDPEVISFSELLDRFYELHDPTQVNGQGPDIGKHYRSVVFAHTDEQLNLTQEKQKKLEESGKFEDPIATEIVPAKEFYDAEEYHQDYARKNPGHPYLRQWLYPKLMKLDMEIPR